MTATAASTTAEGAGGWAIDASVTMPWFFHDEATPFTEELLDAIGAQPLWAPALFVLECSNVLQSAQRRGRIDPDRRAQIAGELASLPVRVDHQPLAFSTLDRLAAAHAPGTAGTHWRARSGLRDARSTTAATSTPTALRSWINCAASSTTWRRC